MPEPLRVLYLDHTARLSGGEIALLRLLQALDRSVVEPVVLLGEDGPLVTKLREAGVETHVLELAPDVRDIRKGTLGAGGIRHLRRLPRLWSYARRVARFARDKRAGLIHTNSLKSDIYGAIAARMARLPLIWHVRDGIHAGYLPLPAVVAFRLMARILPDYVVANSEATLSTIRLPPGKPAAVVPSGVATSRSDRTIRPCKNESSQAVIGIIGRIAPWKGQDVFLNAAEQVLQTGHDAQFWIIGAALFDEKSFEDEMRRRAATGVLKDRVRFLGFRDDVQELLSSLDILVHASTVPEPFGQVIVEGMAAGVPVIAADAGGPREIITDGVNGLLTPPGDAPALACAITGLLEDPDRARRLALAGREHVETHFSIRATAAKMEEIYREIAFAERRR